MSYSQEYFCTHCGAILNDQPGFDPDNGTWTCTECGQTLYGDDIYDGDIYPGVMWYCDSCGALLNKQSGFSDIYSSWTCTECGHENRISEDEIYESEEDYQNSKKNDESEEPKHRCPNCGASLDDQWGFSDYQDDYECDNCGAHLHHSYSDEEYTIIKHLCPHCDAPLDIQWGFNEFDDDWKCTECGVKLHHDYSDDDYTVIDEDDDDHEDEDEDENDIDYGYSESYHSNAGNSSSGSYSGPSSSSANYQSGSINVNRQSYTRQSETATFSKKHPLLLASIGIGAVLAYLLVNAKILPAPNFGDSSMIVTMAIAGGEWAAGIAVSYAFLYLMKAILGIIKTHWKAFVTVLIIVAVIFGGWCYHRYSAQTAVIPISSKEIAAKEYTEIYKRFKDAGFTNVSTRAKEDLLSTNINQEGTVESVTIDGRTSFEANTEISAHAAVVINYHSVLEASCPVSSKEAKGKDYKDILRQFEDAGFTNVVVEADKDLVFGFFSKENAIEEIIIGEDVKKFDSGDRFVQDIKIVIRYHAFKNK